MAVLESLKRFATGKTSAERKKELDFNRMIRREANEAAMVVRKQQAIKFAEERERVIANKKLRTLRGNNSPNYRKYFNDTKRSIDRGLDTLLPTKPRKKFRVI